MPTCSAAEIAEKRRIALEKLQAKKAQPINQQVNPPAPVIAENRRIALEKLKAKKELVANGQQPHQRHVGLAEKERMASKKAQPTNQQVNPPDPDIAENRRIALEKLKAKKELMANGQQPNQAHVDLAEKKRIALERLKAKKERLASGQGTAGNTTEISVSNKPNNAAPPQAAATFLNALKQSNVFAAQRPNAAGPTQNGTPTAQDKMASAQATTAAVPSGTSTSKKLVLTAEVYNTHKPVLGLSPKKPLAPVFYNTVSCKIHMVSPTRFAVNPSSYNAKLIEVFKTIPSKVYDQKTRTWNFALKDYKIVQDSVAVLKPFVTMGVIPKNIINLCLSPKAPMDPACLSSIQPKLANKLLPFQQEGVCFAIAQHGRIMICDEMGLGKTYQALAVADYYREDWPLLICTTASTRESWASHIRELLPAVPVAYIQVLTNNQQYIGDCRVLITSYNMMEKQLNRLLEIKFGFLIFDESHSLKNNKAKCTVVADRLAMQAKHIILLSGTPALSRPLELFSQLQMIDRKFMSYTNFTSRYCDGKQTTFGWDATGGSNLEELNVVLKLKYMIRRTKADVLPDLAAKNRETVVLDPALIWTNDETKQTISNLADNFIKSKGKHREELLLAFYAQTADVKTRAVCAYITNLLTDNMKFIVFAHHRVMMDAITDCLVRRGTNFIRIDGSTKNETRAEYIKTFQTRENCQVALLSLRACNSGITLTAAELIVFAELDWNPSTLAQAESRAHRIGQEKPVTCRYLMAHTTADDHIWIMLKQKQDVLKGAGLFCENLQDAKATAAPTTSHQMMDYYPTVKKVKIEESECLLEGDDSFFRYDEDVLNAQEAATSSTKHHKIPTSASSNLPTEEAAARIHKAFVAASSSCKNSTKNGIAATYSKRETPKTSLSHNQSKTIERAESSHVDKEGDIFKPEEPTVILNTQIRKDLEHIEDIFGENDQFEDCADKSVQYNTQLRRDLENIEDIFKDDSGVNDFFKDDDDAAFMNLKF